MKTWLGGVSMKRRAGLVGKCLIGAVLAGVASSGTLVQTAAADDAMPVKASPLVQTDAVAYWWFHGTVEAGGRDFLNNPQNGRQTTTGAATGCGPNGPGTTTGFPCPGIAGHSLSKYYEYSDIKPGMFGNVWLSMGSNDGLYQVDITGKNIGYDDQNYWLGFSKAGQLYFNFGWDQTPHVYSTSALTPYVVNGSAVTLNPCAATGNKTTAQLLAGCVAPTDIGIRRDTASGDVRWTPDDAWDVRADYSHMSRTGTQVTALSGGLFTATAGVPTGGTGQMQKPVDDVTHNYGLNAERVGTSPWGQKLVVKLGYNGSTYSDNYSFFTVQNATTLGLGARDATWPSNNANGFSGTVAAELPWKSRYVGTLNYTMMRQDDAYIPASTTVAYTLPFTSLNGAINTLLSNNQLTTKITPELTSKLTYRYYDFQNNTPEQYFGGVPSHGDGTTTGAENVASLSMAYTKQNAGADLNWRPTKEWNLGAAYGFERYDWTRTDVNATNENTGKIYVDWKPMSWLTARASGYYGNRRYDNYDYMGNVGTFQWCNPVCDASELYASTYRQLMFSNRETWKGNFSLDLVALHNLTLTPTAKYTEMHYGVDPAVQQGLEDSRKWSAGMDATYVVNRDTSFMIGYMYEWANQLMFGTSCQGPSAPNGTCPTSGFQNLTNVKDTVQTFTAAVRYAVIPEKLNTELRYTASHGIDNMQFYCTGGSGSSACSGGLPNGGQFPQDRTWFQRVDATAVYKFDKEQVAALGWKGDIKAKLHYAWERNAADNWANDPLVPYSTFTTSTLYLAWYNPNYNVHMLSASIVASW